jgi:hypothetical protein
MLNIAKGRRVVRPVQQGYVTRQDVERPHASSWSESWRSIHCQRGRGSRIGLSSLVFETDPRCGAGVHGLPRSEA